MLYPEALAHHVRVLGKTEAFGRRVRSPDEYFASGQVPVPFDRNFLLMGFVVEDDGLAGRGLVRNVFVPVKRSGHGEACLNGPLREYVGN